MSFGSFGYEIVTARNVVESRVERTLGEIKRTYDATIKRQRSASGYRMGRAPITNPSMGRDTREV